MALDGGIQEWRRRIIGTLGTGECCGHFDQDDVLAPTAFFQMAVALDREPELDKQGRTATRALSRNTAPLLCSRKLRLSFPGGADRIDS